MKLNVKVYALTCGIVWGLTVLLCTWWLLLQKAQGEIVSKLSMFYFGYSLSWGGAVIGMLWGFVDGLIVGAIFAWLYTSWQKFLLNQNNLEQIFLFSKYLKNIYNLGKGV